MIPNATASATSASREFRTMSSSQYVIKIFVTVVLVVAISEASKRSSFVGALLASIPVTSVLAMIWLYSDTRDVAQVAALSRSVFWLVLPSLALFVLLPMLLQRGYDFYLSLAASLGATILVYFGAISLSRHLGFKL
jgi:Na+/melibiose symporter-like transporter